MSASSSGPLNLQRTFSSVKIRWSSSSLQSFRQVSGTHEAHSVSVFALARVFTLVAPVSVLKCMLSEQVNGIGKRPPILWIPKKPLERKVRYFEKKNRVGLQTLFFALKTNVILSHKWAKCQMEINVTTILQNTFLTYKKILKSLIYVVKSRS